MAISLNINGKSHSVNSDPDTPLLWVNRIATLETQAMDV